MAKQILVVGLGQFGKSLCRQLTQCGGEVLAVDVNPVHIHEIAPFVADAVVMDAMDEESLASLAPAQRDTCVCAIGDENREGSIIVTALLKQMGAPHIIARATDGLHTRILTLVGADEVINPERSYGKRLAIRLAWHHVVNVMPLGDKLVFTEVEVPESYWGRTLAELELPKRFSVTVVAIRHKDSGVETVMPDPFSALSQGDLMMIVSTEQGVRRLTERF